MAKKKRTKRDTFLFKIIRLISRPFDHKPKFIFTEPLTEPSIIICNHNHPRGPTKWSFYFPSDKFYMWGNGKLCGSLKEIFFAITDTMKRNGTNVVIATVFAFFATPFIKLSFSQSRIIPVYYDMRFYQTIKTSIEEFKDGNHIIIFPDKKGIKYSYNIMEIMPGFLILARQLKEEGYDPYIVASKSNKKRKKIVLDKPMRLSEVEAKYKSDEEILEFFKNRINDLIKD